ncbi:hypothetical protein PSH61_15085 [Pseudomonas rhodesiae]|uniref:hypothetical protein n=1 Tax=Pseudomonas rhodesiae TaxID=76760 RepID=UPI0027349FB2|nr:hypothetical protein [Pseudomonas rhodesiae]WLI27163.1 hypothetical protein PSH61_15085 [Pseudomonas rhodesiae]
MTTTYLNLANNSYLIDSVTRYVEQEAKAKEEPKQQPKATFEFGGVEFNSAPESRNTLIPTPRIG